jgi:hypothetical protein
MPSSDTNLPPLTSDLPSPGGSNPLNAPDEATPGSLSLTIDQLQALGLENCQPGDTYTIKITKSDSTDGEGIFDVDSVDEGGGDDEGMAGEPEAGESSVNPAPDDKGGTPPADANAGSDDSLIGYKRKAKKPREGLPDTKKLRDL